MAVFCEIFDDSTILSKLNSKYKSILIIGCDTCMNESICVKRKLPIYKNGEACGIIYEINRLKSLLEENGFYDVKYELSHAENICQYNQGFLCIRRKGTPYPLLEIYHPDVILALCCPAGVWGLHDSYGQAVPIIPIAKLIGCMGHCQINNETETTIDFSSVIIDKHIGK